jgi:hypothetical protein
MWGVWQVAALHSLLGTVESPPEAMPDAAFDLLSEALARQVE